MLTPVPSKAFGRDLNRQIRRGKDISKLTSLLTLLVNKKPLPREYGDHPLKGAWEGYRDAHIEFDWLLIYRVDDDKLLLARTGTHDDIFSR